MHFLITTIMKNYPVLFAVLLSGIFMVSCNNAPGPKQEINASNIIKADTTKFTPDMVDNKKDPSCGMPVAAGIEDTIHYKNKVLGFCSKECRDDFLKDPEKNLASADLKK